MSYYLAIGSRYQRAAGVQLESVALSGSYPARNVSGLLSFLEPPEGAGLASKCLLAGVPSACVLVVRGGVSSCHSLSLVGSRPDALSQTDVFLLLRKKLGAHL